MFFDMFKYDNVSGDELGSNIVNFYGVEFIKQFEHIKPGTYFSIAEFNFQTGKLSFISLAIEEASFVFELVRK